MLMIWSTWITRTSEIGCQSGPESRNDLGTHSPDLSALRYQQLATYLRGLVRVPPDLHRPICGVMKTLASVVCTDIVREDGSPTKLFELMEEGAMGRWRDDIGWL